MKDFIDSGVGNRVERTRRVEAGEECFGRVGEIVELIESNPESLNGRNASRIIDTISPPTTFTGDPFDPIDQSDASEAFESRYRENPSISRSSDAVTPILSFRRIAIRPSIVRSVGPGDTTGYGLVEMGRRSGRLRVTGEEDESRVVVSWRRMTPCSPSPLLLVATSLSVPDLDAFDLDSTFAALKVAFDFFVQSGSLTRRRVDDSFSSDPYSSSLCGVLGRGGT